MESPNSLLSMNISAAHTPHLHQPTSTRSKVQTWDGEGPNEIGGWALFTTREPGAVQNQGLPRLQKDGLGDLRLPEGWGRWCQVKI